MLQPELNQTEGAGIDTPVMEPIQNRFIEDLVERLGAPQAPPSKIIVNLQDEGLRLGFFNRKDKIQGGEVAPGHRGDSFRFISPLHLKVFSPFSVNPCTPPRCWRWSDPVSRVVSSN